uniref:Uncharacterized protein n=1 Tax=Manihot esculenta TaxID=3983 RepID=A0A2C9WMB6_MANES
MFLFQTQHLFGTRYCCFSAAGRLPVNDVDWNNQSHSISKMEKTAEESKFGHLTAHREGGRHIGPPC